MKGKSKAYLLQKLTKKDYENLAYSLQHGKLNDVVRYLASRLGCSVTTARWLCLKVQKETK